MAIKGVNPRYFAGMDAVALDPNAGKQNPAYAQLLSQAMKNRADEAGRHRENDEENVFKARDRDQQALRDRRSNEISKRNSAVNEAGEKRLQGAQDFEQKRLDLVDTEHLLDALHKAEGDKNDRAVDAFSKALRDRGFTVEQPPESDEDFNARMPPPKPPPPAPPPGPPPVDRSPMPPRSPPPTARFPDAGEAASAPPMRGAPAGVGPRATASFPPASGAPPPGAAPTPSDGIPLLKKTQDMSWTEGKQPPLSMPPRQPPPNRSTYGDSQEQFQRNMEWKPPPPPPPPPDNVYGDSREQFERNMDWHPPTEKELLDRAIRDVVEREAAGLPPMARPLLPGKKLGAP